MNEYIERNAAIDAIMAVYVSTAGYKTRERVFKAEEAVHRLPAADVVEVVRCKDCRFLRFSDFYGKCVCGRMAIVQPWDYCSRGERNDVKTLANRLMETVGETIDCYLEKDGDDPCGQG